MEQEDRRRLLTRIAEDVTSVIYALQADPDEQADPLSLGSAAAGAALRAMERAGFKIVKRT
jgi:hypothetical protein